MEIFPEVSAKVELAHPHDLVVRYFLVDTELFANLMNHYGDSEIIRLIDLNSLRCESPITVDDHLQEVIGDLRFSANFKNGGYSKVLLFFEHQSKKEKRQQWLRGLRKLLEFYESCESDQENMMTNDGKYPYVVMVILYHGKTPWEELLQIEDMVSLPVGVDRHFLSVPTILIDVSRIPHEKLKGPPALVALLDTLQSASSGKLPENFERIIEYFKEIETDQRTYGWLNALTRYFLSITKSDKETVTKTISKVLNEQEAEKMVLSTLEEIFLEGKIEGKIEGKDEGKIESKIQDVLKILNKRFRKVPNSILQSVNSYTDLVALDSLFELALDCETLAEFELALAH
ncbi:MAG: Rpn family recombination-promoting nuclease/putative transposase [Planctomycetaceae bacterium]|jgi:predicted transposase/invertase (TIGR01784 family)|nr:Rpn family recombination-promoting nuclease/putative transposase [Planctomycetaceae bacterium]